MFYCEIITVNFLASFNLALRTRILLTGTVYFILLEGFYVHLPLSFDLVPLFLIEMSVILLFLYKVRSCFKKGLENLWVSSIFEQIDLGQKLLFLLLELSDPFLEFFLVHNLITESLSISMDGLKLSLQILILLQGIPHLFVHHILIWNLEWHKNFAV